MPVKTGRHGKVTLRRKIELGADTLLRCLMAVALVIAFVPISQYMCQGSVTAVADDEPAIAEPEITEDQADSA